MDLLMQVYIHIQVGKIFVLLNWVLLNIISVNKEVWNNLIILLKFNMKLWQMDLLSLNFQFGKIFTLISLVFIGKPQDYISVNMKLWLLLGELKMVSIIGKCKILGIKHGVNRVFLEFYEEILLGSINK